MKLFYLHVFLVLFNFVWSDKENEKKELIEKQMLNSSRPAVTLGSYDQSLSNNSNVSTLSIEVPGYTIKIALIIYGLVFVVGFFGNGLVVIVAFLKQTQHHSFGTTNYCLVNLSLADLLLILVCLPSAILDLFSQEVWYLGHFLCKIL
jgi:hypothetical protein